MSEHGDIQAGEIKPLELHICKLGQDATKSNEVGKLLSKERRTKWLAETMSSVG